MFTFPTSKTPIIFQGVTSEMGLYQLEQALSYGTNVVAGISQETHLTSLMGIPVFNQVKLAVKKFNPKISVIFSTPAHALEDVIQAAKARIPLIICTTEHVPMHDALKMRMIAKEYGVQLLGPSSNGILNVGQALVGTLPVHLFQNGKVAIVGRSSSLIYEAVSQLNECGLGVCKCVALGTDHLIATDFIPVVQSLLKDKVSESILIIGQAHGQLEQELADFIKKQKKHKKIFVYIPGRFLTRSTKRPLLGMESVLFSDIIEQKKNTFEKAGIHFIENVDEIGKQILNTINQKKGNQ